MAERDSQEPANLARSEASQAPTMGSDRGAAPPGEAAPLVAPGRRFGPYAIVRLLGRGGMGEVYDAEELDSGRRVALKLLNRPLSSREERDRFLREGRLAASVSHPHCVYVFGTDEIEGLPTISMELASGGTLKDVVKSRGPLPFREAVDAILHVIAGLEAAAAAGVLHRDIKPANCFVDDDGNVKVGDFGLSTSTVAGDETHLTLAGTIMGTPAFASPEQMRAEDLDVRSDIYSVGATLYYLLTGRAPFEDANVVRLLAMVVQDMPPAPHLLRKDIPKALSAIVMRTLAKRPGDRVADYAALRAALEPFGSGAPVPAPIGFRVLAYIVDYLVVGALSVVCLWPLGFVQMTVRSDSGTVLADGAFSPTRIIAQLVLWAVYWILLEGLSGASLGKRVFRLRVAGAGGEPAGLGSVLLRTAVFLAPPAALGMAWLIPDIRELLVKAAVRQSGQTSVSLSMVPLLVLFVSARPRNAFAGLHELASGTRVLVVESVERVVASAGAGAEPVAIGSGRVGPYAILDEAEGQSGPGLLRGWDVRLRRPVWLQLVPAGFELPEWRRDLARPARLRWLAGKRDEGASWDAYEAVDGRSFLATVETPQPWKVVRAWLRDLSREIETGRHDGSLPALGLDRLWVGSDGRIRLLDWPAPDAAPVDRPSGPAGRATNDPPGTRGFLRRVAAAALGTNVVLPLRAARLLEDLGASPTDRDDELAATVASAVGGPTHVTRGRRALHLAFAGAPPLMLVLLSWLVLSVVLPQLFSPDRPSVIEYDMELRALARLDKQPDSAEVRALREACEIDIAARFPQFQSGDVASSPVYQVLTPESQALVRRIRANHPAPTSDEARLARERVAPLLMDQSDQRQRIQAQLRTTLPPVAFLLWAILGGLAVLLAIAVRGGAVLRLLGIAVVDARGLEAARWRCGVRALLAWLPIFVGVAARHWGSPGLANVVTWSGLAVFLAGAVYAAVNPARGLQDRIAGTWLVPR
jgi:eukaryotic-like serine/threonine-protein kinase